MRLPRLTAAVALLLTGIALSAPTARADHWDLTRVTGSPLGDVADDTSGGPGYPTFLSADGRYVAYTSRASNLAAGDLDGNHVEDVFLFDRVAGTTTLVSHAAGSATSGGNGVSYPRGISSDGRYVLFESNAKDLLPGASDGNSGTDVYLYDRIAAATTLLTHAVGSATTTGNGPSSALGISADGQTLLISSSATNMPGSTSSGLLLYDRPNDRYTLISHAAGSPTTPCNGQTNDAVLSADGQWVQMSSQATDLVAGQVDSNLYEDVFLYSRASNSSVLISGAQGSSTQTVNHIALHGGISADGRWSAWSTTATNVLAGQVDTNVWYDVFLYDRVSHTNVLVTRANGSPLVTATGYSGGGGQISADGRYVMFETTATNVVAGVTDTNNSYDVYLFDRQTLQSRLVSHIAGANSTTPSTDSFVADLSADGSRVVFTSDSTNIIAGLADSNGKPEVYSFDAASGVVSLQSGATATRTAAGETRPIAMSDDGAWLAVSTTASDFAVNIADRNNRSDIYLVGLSQGQRALVSRGNRSVFAPESGTTSPQAMSSDARYVALWTNSTTLVSGVSDNNQAFDVYLLDRSNGQSTLLSHSAASPTTTASGDSSVATMTRDGRVVLITSTANDLVALSPSVGFRYYLYAYDHSTGGTTLLTHTSASATTPSLGSALNGASISDDGRYVAFESDGTDLVAGANDGNHANDIFLLDRNTGAISLVSHAAGSPTTAANATSTYCTISADGRYITYASSASDLDTGVTKIGTFSETVLYDRLTGSNTVVSRSTVTPTTTGNGYSTPIAISADGRRILIESQASDLISGGSDVNSRPDAFLFDRITNTMTLVSHVGGVPGTAANQLSRPRRLTPDGRFVLFYSTATDLVAGLVYTSIDATTFLFDADTGSVELVAHAPGQPTLAVDAAATPIDISDDGQLVLFDSASANVIAGGIDTNGLSNRFMLDRHTGLISLVDHAYGSDLRTGSGGVGGGGHVMTPDGSKVMLSSSSYDLAPDVSPQQGSAVYIATCTAQLFADGFE